MSKKFKEATKAIPWYGKVQASRYKGVKGKAWKVTSDFTRCRDYILFKVCASCPRKIEDWKETDAGHYIGMASNGALIGFSTKNIHMQCKFCNMHASQHTGAYYRDTLLKRQIDLDELERLKNGTVKADDWYFLAVLKSVYEEFQELAKKHPEYDFPEYLVV